MRRRKPEEVRDGVGVASDIGNPTYEHYLRVRAVDRSGKPIEFEASGYHARVLQHEIDHLDGLVYLDRMPDMKSLAYTVNFG